ncbi:carbohydrate ABC transporter permease [Candidatus Poriferisocius sp.]|uniref:carbohydrate ABC transporter permease n=1 Tax=Candidatus Poriferisocius sp. TaxID=3101276 RepID=UPI003B021347
MNRRTFWGFTVPSVIVMLALMVFPLITTVWLGFQKLLLRDLNNPQWIGFDNYTDVLTDPEFWAAFRFTMVFVAVVVPVTMVMGLGVALLLDRVGRGRSLYMAALLLPFIVTPVVGSLVYKDLFERGGLIAWLWEVITDDPFAVDASNVKWLIIIQSIWYVMPFAMITFFAGLQTLPEERVEAAAIDGANFLRNLWHVILPHLRVLILFVGLITIMDAYRVYDQVFVWTGNRFTDAHTLSVYNVRVATAYDIGRLGKGNAIAVLNVIGIFVVLIPFLWRSYKDQIEERT